MDMGTRATVTAIGGLDELALVYADEHDSSLTLLPIPLNNIKAVSSVG